MIAPLDPDWKSVTFRFTYISHAQSGQFMLICLRRDQYPDLEPPNPPFTHLVHLAPGGDSSMEIHDPQK